MRSPATGASSGKKTWKIEKTEIAVLAALIGVSGYNKGDPITVVVSHVGPVNNHPPFQRLYWQALIDAANDAGGKDNIAVVVVKVAGESGKAGRSWWRFGR
jgi:hypothetical protein